MVIWITGLSGSGKSTLAGALVDLTRPLVPQLVLLDGDAVRALYGNDLGHGEADRVIQIRRLQNLALFLEKQDLIVIVAALYAHPDLLAWNRENFGDYFEVHIDASIDFLRRRDPNGLYAKAFGGEMPNVVGVDIPWHAPERPDLTVESGDEEAPAHVAGRLVAAIPIFAEAMADTTP